MSEMNFPSCTVELRVTSSDGIVEIVEFTQAAFSLTVATEQWTTFGVPAELRIDGTVTKLGSSYAKRFLRSGP